jgi:hypothetical protein
MHSGREVWRRRLDEQVEVIRQQGVGDQAPAVPLHDAVTQDEKHPAVLVIVVDGLTAIAARRHVEGAAG